MFPVGALLIKKMEEKAAQPKKFYRKWWFWVLGIFVFFVIIGSGGNSSKTIRPAATAGTSQEEALPVTASQLMRDYEANEIAADAKYKNKLVNVSGTIANIGKDILDTPYVSLDADSLVFGIQCMFAKSDQESLVSLSNGVRVTLQGRVSGKLGNVLVKECLILR